MRTGSATRPRWRSRVAAALGQAADVAGRLVGNVGRGLPGVAGPLLVAYGAHEVYAPAGWVVAGGFLLLLDRRM